MMGNRSSSEVFPLPIDLVVQFPPNWTLAILAAAVLVTLLWIIAIIVVILYEMFGKGHRSTPPPPPSATMSMMSASNSFVSSHSSSLKRYSNVPLGTPPPPVRPPHRREMLREVGVVEGALQTSGDVTVPSPPSLQEEEECKVPLDETPLSRRTSTTSSLISHGGSSIRNHASSSLIRSSTKSSTRSSRSVRSNISSMSDRSQGEVNKKPLVDGGSDDGGASPDVTAGATDVTSLGGNNDGSQSPLSGMVLSRPVTIRQLGATIREPGYVETEFRKLPVVKVSIDTLPPGTERKNRYTNVLPTSLTRVILPEVFGYSNSDYINANFIRGYRNTVKQYIATQGPLESTIEDFWRMILDNDTSIIVMATNFLERGIEKCTRYWPAQGSEAYGSIQVTLIKQTAHGTYNSSTLQVQTTGGEVKTVTHHRLTCWPLVGVPKDTKPITDFLMNVKLADCSGPAVVHCSAGIGRTGVLIACDIGLQGLLQGDPRIDVLRVVSTLRQDRAGMVQTREQYRFIHQALYSMAKEEGTK